MSITDYTLDGAFAKQERSRIWQGLDAANREYWKYERLRDGHVQAQDRIMDGAHDVMRDAIDTEDHDTFLSLANDYKEKVGRFNEEVAENYKVSRKLFEANAVKKNLELELTHFEIWEKVFVATEEGTCKIGKGAA